MAAEPSGQVGWGPLPSPPEPVYDSKDVENYLWEVTHEFIQDIAGERRGISWAATLFRLGKSHTLAASTEQAREADREQCSFADGPVMEALRTGEFVLISDLSRDWRWPGYSSAAAAHGVQSLLSAPIASEGGASAAINLYAQSPHTFTSDDLVRSRTYVRQVARALRVVVRVGERAEATAGIAVVQSSLVLVDLAVRSLMNEYGLTREGALVFLQTQAMHHELDLRDAALSVVAPTAGMAHPGQAAAATPQDLHDGVAGLQPAPAAELDHTSQGAAQAEAARKRRPRSTAGRKTA
ncbi:GAF and ANTAR domain-containing protein [Arthrobacter sp. BHU FT2]|nr:GAF and ANTAR domain-containing protein [Arthrobacter sp. BHU FT2]